MSRTEPSVGYCLSSPSPPGCSAAPAGARDRDRSLRPARPGCAAATALVVGLVLLGAAAAEAQTVRTLVSNSAQAADDSANTSGNDHAQLFHTGGHAAGYTLTTVIVNSEDAEDDDFDVEVCEEDGTADEFPSTTASDCTALTAPASFAGNVIFTHTGLALSANTNYVVVIKQRGTGSVELNSTPSGGEDTSIGLSDWSIKNKFYWKSGSTWMLKSGSNEALRIIVNGYAVTVDTTDATLSALSVSGTTLSPTFAAATTNYQAVVANSVSQATITATTSESTATLEYLDRSDNLRTDADLGTSGLQVNLNTGTNTIKVRVTAPDGITTVTYTIALLRIAATAACSAASMLNQIWTGQMTVGLAASIGFIEGDDGYLNNKTITYNGTIYTVSTVSVIDFFGLNNLYFGLTNSNFGIDAADLVLHVDDKQYGLGDATLTTNRYAWDSNLPSFANGDGVCLALTVEGPSVSSVALTSDPGSDNTYGIGDSVTATVTFDAAVDITGTPQLELDFDGTAKAAACTTATNTTTMACEYEVVAGDSAPNGVGIAANTLTGGTIRATGSTTISADLTHSVVAIDTGHKVDGTTNAPPVFSSPTASRSVAENSVAGTNVGAPVTATDTDSGDTLTYTLEGTAAAAFDIVSTSGQIQTTSGVTYDHEAQPSYAVTVKADDGHGGSDTIVVTITVTDVSEPPARPAAPSVSSVVGSTTSLSVMWTAPANTGPAIDHYDLRYRQGTIGSWTNGPQNVSGTSATITGLGAGSYQMQVLATNAEGDSPWSPPGSGQTNTAGNTAPTFSSPTASRSVAENSAAGTNVGAPVTATDADSGDTLTYTLDGTDAASFDIVSTSGQIQTTSGVTYDYETQSRYAVIVKADDGNGGSDTVMVTITVTDVDESPSPGPEPVPTPALPLLGHLLLALGLTAAGARVIRRRPRVPPAA